RGAGPPRRRRTGAVAPRPGGAARPRARRYVLPRWDHGPGPEPHLGAAHLAELLRRFGGRLEPAIAAYNAGVTPVTRWVGREGADDPDRFIELIPYQETRGYVRSVLRNRELYRALYGISTN